MNKLINHFFRSILLFLITSVILVSCVFESKENKSTNQLTIVVKGKESVSTYKHVDLRFIINTGSLSEQDNEKGFAHLIEHLAFNDTVKYPNETLIPLLEKSGIRLGFHSNATTSFDKTVYRLNLKDPNPQKLELAIDVLSQWAMHVQFNQKTINAEKPVIKEEWRGFQPDEKSWRKQAFKSEFAKSHYLNRLPIGDMDIIESAEAKDLEAFYKRWYQPQNAAVIVTGNIDETQVNKLIDKYFGEWKNTNTSVETNYALSINAIPNTQIISDTNVNGSFTTLNYYTANSRAKTTEEQFAALHRQAVLAILEQRLKSDLQETKGAVASVSSNYRFPTPDVLKVSLVANLSGGAIDTAINLLAQQMKQLLQQGITESELSNWRKSTLKRARLHQESAANLADMAEAHFLYGTPLLRQAEWLTLLEEHLPSLTVKQLNDSTHELFGEQQAKLLVVHNPSITPPSESTLTALLDNTQASPTLPQKVPSNNSSDQIWAISPKTSGELMQTTRFPNGLVEWKFSNGTSVIFKQQKSEPGKVFYVLSDHHGMRYLNDEQSIHARLALETVGGSGLREMNGPELSQWLQNKGMTHLPYYSFWDKGVQGNAATEDFTTAMNLLYVTLTEARVQDTARTHFLEKNRQQLKQFNSSSAKPWQDKVWKLLFQDDAAFRTLTEVELENTSVEDMEALYRQSFAGAQQYRLSIVGDIGEDKVLKTALATIASLPESTLTTSSPRDFPRITQAEEAKIKGSGRKAAVISHKLTLDKSALPDANFCELSYLHYWLRSVLMAELREKAGLVYSVNVILESGIKEQQDYTLTIEMACDPDKVDTLKKRLSEVLLKQAVTPPPSDQVMAWVKESQSKLRSSIEKSQGLAAEISSAPLTGVSLEKILDVDYRTHLSNPSMLNKALSAFLGKKAIPTTMIWMP